MADEQSWRRARREFIRTHHPDRGGDPAAFAAGLAAYDRRPRRGACSPGSDRRGHAVAGQPAEAGTAPDGLAATATSGQVTTS